jgi:hypothetical protein
MKRSTKCRKPEAITQGAYAMKWMIAVGLSTMLLSGCTSLPEMQARSAWEGRPVREVIEYFGVPNQFAPLPDKQWVVLVYSMDTSYTQREALGTYTGPQDGRLVHAEYWGDVRYTANCEIRVAINRARTVEQFSTKGGNCGSVKMKPARN